MLLDSIYEFDKLFSVLRGANIAIFTVWRDKNAEKFYNAYIMQLEMEYRRYVDTMRQRCNSLTPMIEEVQRMKQELWQTSGAIEETWQRERAENNRRNNQGY